MYEYTTIENHTQLNDIKTLMYPTQLTFSEDTPNEILHMLSTVILRLKTFYTTFGQYPTLYDFLAITPKEVSHWKYYLAYHNKCVKPNIFDLHYYHHISTHRRSCITYVIQVNPQMCLSVILSVT